MGTTKTLQESDLNQFTGTEHWYRHALNRRVTYTDGVKYLAETGGAYWLIDEIAFSQIHPKVKAEPFQSWTLQREVGPAPLHELTSKATLSATDGNKNVIFRKKIEYTDFPLPS